MEYLVGLMIWGAVVVLALSFRTTQRKKVSLLERLKQVDVQDPAGVGLRDAEKMDKSLFTRVILPMAGKYGDTFMRLTPVRMVSSAEKAIGEAGMEGKLNGVQLTAMCWMLAVGLVLLFAFMFTPHVLGGKMNPAMLLGLGVIGFVLGIRLPLGIVQGRAKKRKDEIQMALPFSFDLISVGVQAGMSFDGAMQVVSERTKGAFSEELKRTLREVNLGISRHDALNNLATRTGVEDLKTFITAVNYISKLGGNLTDAIKVQTDALRVKRRQRAEEKANQAPVKIMIPLVLFILPCVFIVILAPAGLLLFMGNAEGGG
jgi:tight adherence protein C